MIKTVYLIVKGGVQIHTGKDGAALAKKIEEGHQDTTPFIFYEKNMPVYVAKQFSEITELAFPQPKDYGLTSPELYGHAITFKHAVARLIKLRARPAPGLAEQIKKVMTLAFPIVVMAFLILILVIAMGGKH